MINRRIAISALSIVAALTVTVGATYAVFSDTATSTGNTFSTGNADLLIAVDNPEGAESFQDSMPGFNNDGLFPGFEEVFRFWLQNASEADIDLDLIADVDAFTETPSGEVLADTLLLSWRCDLSGTGDLADEEYTAEFSVKDWFDGGEASLGDLANGDSMICEMKARVPESAGDEIAGLDLDFDIVYDGSQVVTP